MSVKSASTSLYRHATNLQGVIICIISTTIFLVCNLYHVTGNRIIFTGEAGIQLELISSAASEILQRHFPPQFPNNLSIVLNPVYSLYSCLFYTVAGLINAVGLNVENALVASISIFIGCGVAGLYLLSRNLDCRPVPSAIGAVSFLLTPYLATDLFVRLSLAELSFWCIFPVLVAFLVKFIRSPSWQTALTLEVTMILFELTHKIFFAWSLVLVLIALIVLFDIKRLFALSPALSMIAITATLIDKAYVLDPLFQLSQLNIVEGHLYFSELTSGFQPFRLFDVREASLKDYPFFSLAIGYTGILGLMIILCYSYTNIVIRSLFAPMALTIIGLTSFFGAIDFNGHLPLLFATIQFPYRLLVFVSFLSTVAISTFLSDNKYTKPKTAIVVAVMLLQIVVYGHSPISAKTDIAEIIRQSARSVSLTLDRDYGERPLTDSHHRPDALIERQGISVSGNRASADLTALSPEWVLLPIVYTQLIRVYANSHLTPVTAYGYEEGGTAVTQSMVYLPSGNWHLDILRRPALHLNPWPWVLVSLTVLAMNVYILRAIGLTTTLIKRAKVSPRVRAADGP